MIEKKEIFGLLGPNGAGKTTLISMFTGLYEPDEGNAWISGFDIKNEIDKVQLEIGFCPQFDILWPDLTVREHLLFYSRIKGNSRKSENNKVKNAIKEVQLEKFTDYNVKKLSGLFIKHNFIINENNYNFFLIEIFNFFW